jgi:hypothetical protein
MNLHKNWKLTFALLALGVGMTAAKASAETVLKGSFNLPTQAYWGSNLLEPGEYSFTVDMTMGRTPMVHLRGEGVNALVLSSPVSAPPSTDRTFLTLESINGTYAVRELSAGAIGRSYDFIVSKSAKGPVERSALTVPIVASTGR